MTTPPRLCKHCGQPMRPAHKRHKVGEYEHAQGCPYQRSKATQEANRSLRESDPDGEAPCCVVCGKPDDGKLCAASLGPEGFDQHVMKRVVHAQEAPREPTLDELCLCEEKTHDGFHDDKCPMLVPAEPHATQAHNKLFKRVK